MFPSVSGDNLYFASNGIAGFGGLDLFSSTLTEGKWSKAANLGQPINSSFDDFAMILDPRSKKGFFSSNRPGGLGSDDIYACRLIDSKQKKKSTELLAELDSLSTTITGFVKEKQTLKPMPGSTVFLLNTQTEKVEVLKTDADGRFTALISKGVFYVVKGMENNYVSDCINFKFEISDTSRFVDTPRDLLLDRLEVNKIFSVNNMDYSIETIYYDFDKWFIRSDAEKELDRLVQLMKENPVSVELGSHTDSRGSFEYNIDLSQKRAESAVRYIVLQGISASRISAKGYGESQLMNECSDGVPCSPAKHQANRRTEFKVTGFSESEANSVYDMSKFKGDEEIPSYLFDRDFFINCLQEKKMVKYAAETSEQNLNVPAGDESSQVVSIPDAEEVITKEPESVSINQPEVKASTKSGVVTYRVQLMALSREKSLLDREFEVLEDVQIYVEDGLYKYTSGVFDTHEEALDYRSEMVQLGYRDAFVVTFSNGKRIYVSASF
jgi:outer membrane protein OmpA-like peptidoglycan-associated protein